MRVASTKFQKQPLPVVNCDRPHMPRTALLACQLLDLLALQCTSAIEHQRQPTDTQRGMDFAVCIQRWRSFVSTMCSAATAVLLWLCGISGPSHICNDASNVCMTVACVPATLCGIVYTPSTGVPCSRQSIVLAVLPSNLLSQTLRRSFRTAIDSNVARPPLPQIMLTRPIQTPFERPQGQAYLTFFQLLRAEGCLVRYMRRKVSATTPLAERV